MDKLDLILEKLDNHQETLDNQQKMLEYQQKTLDNQQRMLEHQQETLDNQQKMLAEQHNEIVKINLTLENRVFPALEALAEGQKTILETMASKSRVEALEDEVAFLKQMIRTLAQEVNDLKKAQ